MNVYLYGAHTHTHTHTHTHAYTRAYTRAGAARARKRSSGQEIAQTRRRHRYPERVVTTRVSCGVRPTPTPMRMVSVFLAKANGTALLVVTNKYMLTPGVLPRL